MPVAALYIDDIHGPYPSLLGSDLVWGVGRDARTYAGPHPIIAHPPCGPWGRMSAWAYATDRELALVAVRQLKEWGGVLEHPEGSSLWRAALLDLQGGFTLKVDQCDWGHPCRKRSWIWVYGYPADLPLPSRPQPGAPTHSIRGALPELPKNQRHLTPPAFAAWLIEIAAQCRGALNASR